MFDPVATAAGSVTLALSNSKRAISDERPRGNENVRIDRDDFASSPNAHLTESARIRLRFSVPDMVEPLRSNEVTALLIDWSNGDKTARTSLP